MATRHNVQIPRFPSRFCMPPARDLPPGVAKPALSPDEALRLLVRTFREFVILLEADGTVLAVSTAKEMFSEQAREALLGEGLRRLLGEGGFAALAEIFRRVVETHRREDLACRVERGDGPHWYEVRVKPALRRRGAGTLCLVAQEITPRKKAEEEERRKIAEELHDSTAQNLAALRMNLSRMKSAAGADSLREILDATIEFADASLQEVRTLSYLLHPPLVEERGLEALRSYAAGFAERSGIEVAVEMAEDFGRLPQEVERGVFRTVQEALLNAHRHSGSPTVRIRLARGEGNLELEIRDRGRGLPEFEARGAGERNLRPGVGLAAMRERVERLNGTMEMTGAPGQGTSIRILLPLEARPRPVKRPRQKPTGFFWWTTFRPCGRA